MTSHSAPPTRAEKFGEYVASAARAAGYDIDSQRGGGRKALADATGMSPSSVGRMLAGQTIPDPGFFEPLAAALRVPLDELLVRSGIISEETFTQSDAPPRAHPLTPERAAAELGITSPDRIQLFVTLARSLIAQERESGDRGSWRAS